MSLNVEINSFSFKKGLPKDESGNGGGFIFDCRGILNPGRFDRYKKLSGKDLPVQEFLLNETLFPTFINAVKTVLKISLDDYVAREFSNLQISFGCTGGQHRSVFSAETIFKFIEENYPTIELKINHLNQENWVK